MFVLVVCLYSTAEPLQDALAKANKNIEAALDAVEVTTVTNTDSFKTKGVNQGKPMIHSQIVKELGGNEKAAVFYEQWLRKKCPSNKNTLATCRRPLCMYPYIRA